MRSSLSGLDVEERTSGSISERAEPGRMEELWSLGRRLGGLIIGVQKGKHYARGRDGDIFRPFSIPIGRWVRRAPCRICRFGSLPRQPTPKGGNL